MAEVRAEPSTSALVVVDVQNDFCHPDGVFARAGFALTGLAELIVNVNTLVRAARDGGRPVVWIRMEWSDDESVGVLAERSRFLRREGLRAGTWGSELVDGLDVSAEDLVVTKQRFSAFYRTDLESRLRGRGVTTLVTAGVRTDFCVESTVRDAFFRDFRVVVAQDATASYVDDLHANSLRVMNTVFAQVTELAPAAEILRGGGDPT
ncbi:cysteine hydrolase family protein [Micromonospora radicis]|uniref:Cysteine hydrolase n=1 Tax=Micromonospora radicis TaxID=1894971 RepID=A0A418MYF2_9ACTN|nr:isochorismatase family cysteine hydrolase [Micromonospora radicis]RIV40028.1 cysteine hydrolase [Micromonospora radicis]